MAGRYLKIYADLRHKSGGLRSLKNRGTRPCAAMGSRRRWRRSKNICMRKAEMNKKNIENPLTIEQLREMVEADREGDAP